VTDKHTHTHTHTIRPLYDDYEQVSEIVIKCTLMLSYNWKWCLRTESCSMKDLDPSESVDPDWIVTSMSNEVLNHAAEFPEDLKKVEEEDVRLLVSHLITIFRNYL